MEARRQMLAWATDHAGLAGKETFEHLVAIQKTPKMLDDDVELRRSLLDFIADFANWDNSATKEYLETSRALTQVAHEALGGAPGTRPLVIDPFAGGGSIPLEALRVGADTFASDLNPVAVLLNKVVLDYIPKYGQGLANEVREWGEWVGKEAEKELAEFYPKDSDGAMPVAYLWARTVKCEGPSCGAEVPLIRSMWLAKKANRSIVLYLVPRQKAKRVDLKILVKRDCGWVAQDDPAEAIVDPKFEGTVKRGSATCPCCGFTTPSVRVRSQLKGRRGGGHDARLICVVTSSKKEDGVQYRTPLPRDQAAVTAAGNRLIKTQRGHMAALPSVPDEPYPDETASGALSASVLYGIGTWGGLFADRPALVLSTISRLVRRVLTKRAGEPMAEATTTCLAFCVSKLADYLSSLCVWRTARSCAAHTFGRQALPMAWDFAEMNPFAGSAGDWSEAVRYLGLFIDAMVAGQLRQGLVDRASAIHHPMPDDSAQVLCTDPPYYDAIAYGDLSDFFYVWLRRILGDVHPSLFLQSLTNKDEEIVQLSKRYPGRYSHKTKEFFESLMTKALRESRRVVQPSGIGIVVFAHKSTSGWEAMLQSLIEAGWIVTGSWTIDTERGGRLNSNEAASLASSVHIVCRPRENPDGSLRTDEVGDWRDILVALPKRIHEWMPRLREEGIVGADAIFACLGPALEIFSRYSKVEKASGEVVMLKEYLEHVWAAVAKEALAAIFSSADTAAFEEDARLTAMWLWTLNGGAADGGGGDRNVDEEGDANEDEAESGASKPKAGFELEYDAARKIAQGLGAHLEDLASLVAVKGATARLLPVAERAKSLFGQPETAAVTAAAKKKRKQLTLGFVAEEESESESKAHSGLDGKLQAKPGTTVLDRVHQAMILFGAGRSEALRRFLVDDGAGKDDRFWRLGQALAALYPTGTDERRWIEGVMARKKGLGL
jgi:adenine-specific DNA methylase